MNSNMHAMAAVLVMAGVTFLLRVLPFLIFGKRKTPSCIVFLGKFLPYSIMGMLVVYCLKGISFAKPPFGVPELLSCGLVILLHRWKRNTLLSIIGGTACYMLLIRL